MYELCIDVYPIECVTGDESTTSYFPANQADMVNLLSRLNESPVLLSMLNNSLNPVKSDAFLISMWMEVFTLGK